MSEKKNLPNNIVIYTSQSLQSYKDYGIGIPMLNERVTKTFDFIKDKYAITETPFELLNEYGQEVLQRAHTKSFLQKVKDSPDEVVLRTYELIKEDGSYHRYDPSEAKKPLSDFIDKSMMHVNGTILACKSALELGVSYHLGGGMHHAMSDGPGGFCMFNDIVIAIRTLQKEGRIKKAMVIDMDAHKGDGTAEVSYGDETIRCFSIHMKEGWPLTKDDKSGPSFTPSDLDVPVSPEDDYLKIFKEEVSHFVQECDLAIVVHGADVYEKDELESAELIKLTKEQVLERDAFIHKLLSSQNIPQAWVMAGGYGRYVHEVFTAGLDHILSEYIKKMPL